MHLVDLLDGRPTDGEEHGLRSGGTGVNRVCTPVPDCALHRDYCLLPEILGSPPPSLEITQIAAQTCSPNRHRGFRRARYINWNFNRK